MREQTTYATRRELRAIDRSTYRLAERNPVRLVTWRL